MTIEYTRFTKALAATSGLILFTACGGGSQHGTPPLPRATGLEYTNPATTGWRLVKAPGSTPTHLMLELRAPSGTAGMGIGLKLTLDEASAQWSKVAATDTTYVKNTAFDLGADTATQLCRGKVNGGELVIGAYQKGTTPPVTYSNAIVTVAIDFKAAAGTLPGTVIPLWVSEAEPMGADGALGDIKGSLRVGTLKTK